jgi:hypothetical protein
MRQQYVYDPHLKPMFEDMLATLRHHSQCLSDPISAIVNPDEDEADRSQMPVPSPSTPWSRYHPSRQMGIPASSDNELQREMDFLGIPDVHEDQFASPGSVSAEFKGLNPSEDYSENEARRGGKLGSALGIDLLGEEDTKVHAVSGTTTAIEPIFGHMHDSGISHTGWMSDEGHFRRRRPERDITNLEKSFLTGNSSQSTIVPALSVADVPLLADSESRASTPGTEHIEQQLGPEGGQTTLSSPTLTESSIIDVTSYAPSAFSVSSASDNGDYDMPSSAFPSHFSTRMHSPAFSNSSYEVLSPPARVASMSDSLHDMDASISLETYPPFDEYNVHYARHHTSRAVSHASSHASDSGWTDGDLASEDDW